MLFSLWHAELSLRKHLEDGPQPATFRGNLDLVTKAVTESNFSLYCSTIPFVGAGLTE